ncbi:MAG: molybdate ABC transporter substrate-binding protein [Pseudomonadota bacterium]
MPASAERANIAVASNFKPVMEAIEPMFEASTGHDLVISSGSTAKLYSQVRFGAPFDVFLSADMAHPERLIDKDLAIANSMFTYAVGRLTIWSWSETTSSLEAMTNPATRKIAMATPAGAPYGVAAEEVLAHYGLTDAVAPKLVLGESIGQAFAFAHTGNADLGIVSLSLVLQLPEGEQGHRWDIPASAHTPIAQGAILLSRGADNDAALAFLAFLASEDARQIIRQYGFETP